MHRRDLSKVLLATAAGSAVIARNAEAQTCAAPCYALTQAEINAHVTPTNYAYPPLNVLRYGADPTYTNLSSSTAVDSAAAINNASKVANQMGGGTVYIPAGTYKVASQLNFYTTPNLGQTVFQGAGKVSTTIYFVFSTSVPAWGVSAASTRIYDCGIRDLTIVNSNGNQGVGSCTVGLDLDSVSTSHFEHVTISSFPIAAQLRSALNGGAVYTRWYDVTAQMDPSNANVGFLVNTSQSNSAHFFSCRYNGPNNTIGTAWSFIDSNGCSVIGCDIDNCLVGYSTAAPSGPGYCDGITFCGNRNEDVGTLYSFGMNTRYMHVSGNYNQNIGKFVADSGLLNNVLDPPQAIYQNVSAVGSATGAVSFNNGADSGGPFPFFVIDDTASGAAGAIGLQIRKKTSPSGIYFAGYQSGAATFQIGVPGGFGCFGSNPPTSKPSVTGSKGGNDALASLIQALASYGLITDSTT